MITLDIAQKYGWEYLGNVGGHSEGHLEFRKKLDLSSEPKFALMTIMEDDKVHIKKQQYKNQFTGKVRDETQFSLLLEMLELK